MPGHESIDHPTLELRPGGGQDAPTILVDGEPLHDPAQPFREVLPLAGRQPDVVALLGVGLGYPVAGALRLCPGTRIVAWEPLPGLAPEARRILAEEWKVPRDRVLVAEELADFTASLIEALAGARSLAVVELRAAATRLPHVARAFRAAIRDAVDAGTLGALPEDQDPDFFGNVARATAALAATPPAAALADRLGGVPVVVVDRAPDPALVDALRRLAPGALAWASLEGARSLRAHGLPVDVLLPTGTGVPSAEDRDLASGAVLLLAPGVHPDWWEVPCRHRLLLGHTAATWLLPPGDVAEIVPLRWGPLLPLAVTALHAGAGPLWILPWEEPAPADQWNRLLPATRVRSALERMALGSGRALIELTPRTGRVRPARDPRERLAGALAGLPPLGEDRVRAAIHRARDGIRRLGVEALLHREAGLLPRLADHLARRAAADPFARVFLAPGLRAAETFSPGGLDRLREGALGFLEWMERRLPGPPPPAPAAPAPSIAPSPVTVILPVTPGEEIPARVLMWSLDRRCDRPIRIRRLLQEAPDRLGELFAGLPREAWFLAAAALLEPGEHAIYLEPSVLLLDDVGRLWDLAPTEAPILVPAEGAPTIARIDRVAPGQAPRDLLRALRRGELAPADLRPGGRAGFGPLPPAWSARDRVDLTTSAARMTCAEWLPWRSPLHPLAWLWEFQFLAACEAGYVTPRELRRAVERGELRADLLEGARGLRVGAEFGVPGRAATAREP